jgi:hypothetical protein
VRARDLDGAAVELDRRGELEATLVTGLELSRARRDAGPFAPAAVREADRAASTLRAEVVPIDLPSRARYLAIPAAVLAGMLLMPSRDRGARRISRFAPVEGGGGSAKGAGSAIGAEDIPEDAFAARGQTGPDEIASAVRRQIEQGARVEEALRRLTPPPSSSRADARAVSAEPDATDEPGAAGGDAASRADVLDADDGRAGRAPVDLEEEAALVERFPDYAEVIRRYFAGRR